MFCLDGKMATLLPMKVLAIRSLFRTYVFDAAYMYAQQHDTAMRNTLAALVQREELRHASPILEALCSLPHKHGGLGLRSAIRTSPAAYWASVADAIPEIQKRYPQMSQDFIYHLLNPETAPASLAEATHARVILMSSGYVDCPPWQEIANGLRPEMVLDTEPGEWAHGWQFCASSKIEAKHRETTISAMTPSARATSAPRLRST